MADHRPNVYMEDNMVVLRASSLGNCIGELVRHGLGYAGEGAPEFLTNAYADGVAAEAEIIRRGRSKAGIVGLDGLRLAQYGSVGDDGQVETELIGKGFKVRCHPDGVGQVYKTTVSGERKLKTLYVEEAKFLGDGYWNTLMKRGIEAIPFYAWQLSVEMAATGLPGVYYTALKKKTDDGGVEIADIDVHWYETPPFSKAEVLQRAGMIAKLVRAGEIVDCDSKQFPCPFFTVEGTLCHGAEGGSDDDVVDDATLVKVQHLKKLYVEGGEQQDHAKKELVALFKEKGLRKLEGVSWVGESTRRGSVDYAKMKKNGIDVEEYRKDDVVVSATVRVEKNK